MGGESSVVLSTSLPEKSASEREKMSKQSSVIDSKAGRVLHSRDWRTWRQHFARAGGTIRYWGIISHLHRPDQLLLDFDCGKDIPCPPLNSLAHTCGFRVRWQEWNRTRRGWHLIVRLREKLTDGEIIAAQAILGSDLARERLNLSRAISIRLRPSKFWRRRINLLFQKKVRTRPCKKSSK